MSDSSEYFLKTYKRHSPVFVSGSGAILIDKSGKEYLDFLAGIAVVSIGHANKYVAEAIYKQAQTLGHISNYFWSDAQLKLADKLHELVPWGKLFFANSGAEANECAIKIARKWGAPQGKHEIIAAHNSFHGRTYGALSLTGQPKKWTGFTPLLPGCLFADFNSVKSFESCITDKTVAIFIEPIQGEYGVLPAETDFLVGISNLCKKRNLLLILDEVQGGVARTGKWWSHQNYPIASPDIMTSAKGLANGFPIGCCIASENVANAISYGDHGTTFGGSPLASSAALATLEFIEENDLLTHAHKMGEYFDSIFSKIPGVKHVRGFGLMKGVVLEKPIAEDVQKKCFDWGLIINNTNQDVIRIVPPLIVTQEQVIQASEIFSKAVSHLS
jgi:acetylornithine/N-succinyldiaminopimelate aminotransferase